MLLGLDDPAPTVEAPVEEHDETPPSADAPADVRLAWVLRGAP
jgi:hypothetical protein